MIMPMALFTVVVMAGAVRVVPLPAEYCVPAPGGTSQIANGSTFENTEMVSDILCDVDTENV
jgi:hypothetical protein